ncbi:hypothetical protein ACJMK2_011068 [Sinanodonta woodiana]|uniref:Tantalus-like domain-containing protein n=1 Tax=Sinanodonta woodiana TaxID=1069815 RepID=A0ABD3V652_SINWO
MDELEANVRKTRRRSMRNLRRQSLIFGETSNEDCSSFLLGVNKVYTGDKEKDVGTLEQYGSLWMETNNLSPPKKLRRRRSSIVPVHSVDLLKTDSLELEIENLRAVEKEETCTTPSIKSSFFSPMSMEESMYEPNVYAQTIVKDAHPATPVSVFSSDKNLAVSSMYKSESSGLCDLLDRLNESKHATNIDLDTAYSNLDISTSTPRSRADSSIGSLDTSIHSMSPDFPRSPSTMTCFQQESQNNHADSYQGGIKAGDESPHSVSHLSKMLESSSQGKDGEVTKMDQSHNDSKNDSLGSSFLSLCRTLAGKVANLVRISPPGDKTSESEFSGNVMYNSPILHEKHNGFKEADNSSAENPTDAVADMPINTSVIVTQKLSSFPSVEKQQSLAEDSGGSLLTPKKPVKRKSSVSKAFLDTFRAVSEELNKERNIDENQRTVKKLSDDKSNERESTTPNEIQSKTISDGRCKFDRLCFDSCENNTLNPPLTALIKVPSADDNAFAYSSEVTTQEIEDTWNVLGLDTDKVNDKIVEKIANACESHKVHTSQIFSQQNNEMIFQVKEENTEEQTFRIDSLEQATVEVSFTQLKKSLGNTRDTGTQAHINIDSNVSLSLATSCKEQYSGQENVNETCESCIQENISSKDMLSKCAEQMDDEEAQRILDFLTMEDSATSLKNTYQPVAKKKKRRSELIFLQENYADSIPPDVEMNYDNNSCRARRRRGSADRAVMRLLQGSSMAQLEEEEAESLSTAAESLKSDCEGSESSHSEKMKNRRTGRKKTQEFGTALQDISNASTSGVTGRIAKKRGKDFQETSLEELYKNKNYKKPEEKMWETIFEQSDSTDSKSEEQIFSKKRYQRVAMFEKPTQLKLRRRLQKAIKNGWDPKTRKRMTLPDAIVEAKIANLEIELKSILDS